MTTLTESADYIKSLPSVQTLHTAELTDKGCRIIVRKRTFAELNLEITKLALLHGCHLVAVY